MSPTDTHLVPDTPTVAPVTTEPTDARATSTPRPENSPKTKEPTVQVFPLRVMKGMEVSNKAQGFPVHADLNIGIGRVNSEYDVLTQSQADGDGSLTAEVTVHNFVGPENN